MKILACSKHPHNTKFIEDVDLDTLLKKSDIVSLNCDLNEASRELLTKEKLDLLKRDAILVTATWDILDLNYLIKKLQNKEIFGAGFDVAIEGSNKNLPKELLALDNVVLTPHIAYFTQESKIRQVDICIDNIENFIKDTPQNIVN